MRLSKNNKGITLMALVITIILLLILAGITTASLISTGLFSAAQDAKTKTEEKAEEEKAKLQNYASEISRITGQSTSGSGTGEDFGITVAQIKANPKKYYGKEVTNYTSGGLTYRIFYVDENNKIYLKGDDKTSTNLNDYANRGDSESSWNINEKAAAWLCSPVNSTTVSITTLPWKNYFDSTKAEYVVGGPSVEMYVKSYNQTHDKDANGKDALGYQYQTNNAPGYGYKVYNEIQNDGWYINRNILDATTTYGNIYAGKNGEKTGSWWFVSPSANNSGHICSIDGSTANLDYDDYEHERGLSPVVLLKSGINVQVKE